MSAKIPAAVAALLMMAFAGSAFALTDAEGSTGSGGNDLLATAQDAGDALPGGQITIQGWIDSDNENDVDFYQFTLPVDLTLYFDIDLAEDVGAVSDEDNGLDAEIWVFDAGGTLIASNDDSDFFDIGPANDGTDPGSDPFADHDSFIGPLALMAGTYYVAVSYYENDADAESQPGYDTTNLAISGYAVTGTTPDATFENGVDCTDPSDPSEQCTGSYRLQIRDRFNDVAVSPAPTLGAAGLLLLGMLLLVAGVIRLSAGHSSTPGPA
jgi:hypothetical protein